MKNFTKWDGKIGAKVDKWRSCVYVSGDICAHPGRKKGKYWNEDWCGKCPCLTFDEIESLCDFEIMGWGLYSDKFGVYACGTCVHKKEGSCFCICSPRNGYDKWEPKKEED